VKAVEFHPAAKEEAREAAVRHDGIRSDLGDDFRAELKAAIERAQRSPLTYAVESGTIRIAPLHRFPYSLIYEDLPARI
jgi:hypothetical protein